MGSRRETSLAVSIRYPLTASAELKVISSNDSLVPLPSKLPSNHLPILLESVVSTFVADGAS